MVISADLEPPANYPRLDHLDQAAIKGRAVLGMGLAASAPNDRVGRTGPEPPANYPRLDPGAKNRAVPVMARIVRIVRASSQLQNLKNLIVLAAVTAPVVLETVTAPKGRTVPAVQIVRIARIAQTVPTVPTDLESQIDPTARAVPAMATDGIMSIETGINTTIIGIISTVDIGEDAITHGGITGIAAVIATGILIP
ncbi:MAG: hypothetical protein H6752_07680 [Candidatus Omnitrophica bacterium]|nr:hypothetical protein [Candidatus Omnitrophota bacterium]